MCEVICINVDKTHPDPIKDRMAWKKGMPIAVRRDGWSWSETEKSSFYKIIKLPDVPVESFERYLEPEYEDPLADELVPIRRRRYKLKTEEWSKTDDTAAADSKKTPAQKLDVLKAKLYDYALAK